MESSEVIAFRMTYSEISEEELFSELGESSSNIMGFEDATQDEKKKAGLSWWHINAGEIKELVCKTASEKEANAALVKDIIQIVFSLIGAKYGMGVATYAAAIAARRVIAGWCSINEKH